MPQGFRRRAVWVEDVDEGPLCVGAQMGVRIRGLKESLRTPTPRLRVLSQVVVDGIPSQRRPVLDIQDADRLLVVPRHALLSTVAGAGDRSKAHKHPFVARRQAFVKAATRFLKRDIFAPCRVCLLDHVRQDVP